MRENLYFILDPNGDPIPALNSLTWAKWFSEHDSNDRRIAETRTKLFWISTVFLGINHQWRPDGPPHIFESMAFLQPRRHDISRVSSKPIIGEGELCERYSTRLQAMAGHVAMVAEVLAYERDFGHAEIARLLRRKAPSARAKKRQLLRAA